VCYTTDYAGSVHAFETTRKASWVADSLVKNPITGVELVPNASLTEAAVARVHAPAYVTAVRTGVPRVLAESQGFAWDPQLWPMVLASNGGVVAAASAALANGVAGSLSSGLHHACRDHGAGFCTFNGLAIAALHALDQGAKRVLIVDLDAHCGGGTHSLLGVNPAIHILDVSVVAFDRYQPSGRNTLDLLSEAKFYLPTIERRLVELRSEHFDLCLYNAGMDPHEHCPVGGLTGIDKNVLAKRENLVFSWCQQKQLPIAFVLAGGYIGPGLDQAGLVDLHRLTMTATTAA
jgi:acetoin utilization deacetylase AcuC-like enzyme